MDLYDRQRELEQLDVAAAAAAEGQGALVVVEGEAGVGKTRLVGAAVERAQAAGLDALCARGGALERDFPFGVVRQLFERRLACAPESVRAELLEGAAALAGPVLGWAQETPLWEAPDLVSGVASYPRLHGLYWLAGNLAEQQPLVLAVDDAHWADEPSLRWLGYLGARVGQLPILLVIVTRLVADTDVGGMLDAVIAIPDAKLIQLGALSREAIRAITRERFGDGADDAFCDMCYAMTDGNPFYLRELVEDLWRTGVSSIGEASARLSGAPPQHVRLNVKRRITGIGPDADAITRAVAILGANADPPHVRALIGADALSAIDDLVDARILADDTPLRFVHPIVREAVYSGIPTATRGDAHLDVARMLSREGAAPEAVSMHLLATPPRGESWVVEQLEAAAALAMERGTPAAAAGYLRRALDELPGPVDPALLWQLGRAEMQAGDTEAVARLHSALDRVRDPECRAELAIDLARAHTVSGRLGDAVRVLTEELDGTPGLAEDTQLRMEAELVSAGRLDISLRAVVLERLARRSPAVAGTRPGERLLLAHHAYEAASRSAPAEEGLDLARRALGSGALLRDVGPSPHFVVAAWALALYDELEEADAAFTGALGAAREAGTAMGFAVIAAFRSSVRVWRGALGDAVADAGSCDDALEHGWHPIASAFLVDALRLCGRLDEARSTLASIGMLGHIPEDILSQPLLYARGDLQLAEGRVEDGVRDLLEGGRRARDAGIRSALFRPWRSSAALGLISLGRREEAETLIAEELSLACESGVARAIGVAFRALGLLEGGIEGMRHLEEAVATLRRSPALAERAHALVELGGAQRRMGMRSVCRGTLREGLELAYRLGSDPLVERARVELAAAGARPRRAARVGADALTPSERRVASLAAEGMTNRQIAQALFVTLKTIEWHLAHAYQKLDITRRADLAAALGEPAIEATPAVGAPAR